MSKRALKIVARGGAYNGIIKELDAVCRIGGNNASRVFGDWVRICEYTQRRMPFHVAQIAKDGKPAEDDEEGKALWAECIQRHRRESFDHFANAYAMLIDYASDWLETGGGQGSGFENGPDLLGPLHMNYGYANEKAGQFFTPWNVCVLMAKVTAPEECLWANLKAGAKRAAAEGGGIDALLSVFGIMGLAFDKDAEWRESFLWDKLLPLVVPYTEPVTFNEPCCGSGTLILAFAFQFPEWARAAGLVQITGMDIDAFCVTMTRLNCMLYGVSGEHVRHIFALTAIERERFPARVQKVIELAVKKGKVDDEIVEQVSYFQFEKLEQMSLF